MAVYFHFIHLDMLSLFVSVVLGCVVLCCFILLFLFFRIVGQAWIGWWDQGWIMTAEREVDFSFFLLIFHV